MDYGKGVNFAGLRLFQTTEKRPDESLVLVVRHWCTGWTTSGVSHVELEASELRVVTLDRQSTVVYRNDGVQKRATGGLEQAPDGATIIAVVPRPDKTTWVVGTLPATGGVFTPLRSLGWSVRLARRIASEFVLPRWPVPRVLEGEKGLRRRSCREPRRSVMPANTGSCCRRLRAALGLLTAVGSPCEQSPGSVALWTIRSKTGSPLANP